MNYGLVVPARVETKEAGAEHVLGSTNLPEPVILPSGDWTDFLVEREPQQVNGVETNACTYYGTLTAIEMQERFLGETTNHSDRYPANVGKQLGLIDPNVGANPHNTAEVIRKHSGLVSEADAPWGVPYYELDTEPLKEKAFGWYKNRRLYHKWVFTSGTPEEKRALLQEALTKGTVCVSVKAWTKKNGRYVKPVGAGDNHWVTLISAVEDKPYFIFDSYDSYIKELDPLYDFNMAKVYFLRPVLPPFTTNLALGMTHPDVANMQRALVSLGHSIPNGITNYFGKESQRALWAFQVSKGISDDGTHFGPRTRNALNREMNPSEAFGGSFFTFLQALFSGV